VCRELHEAGFSPFFVWGALSFEKADTKPPKTVAEAEQRGSVHFWAELDWDDKTLIVDISSEIPFQVGEPYVDFGLPDCYIRPNNSRFRYEPDKGITTSQLLNEEGYQFLIEQELSVPTPE
jgi:hypothetical protein